MKNRVALFTQSYLVIAPPLCRCPEPPNCQSFQNFQALELRLRIPLLLQPTPQELEVAARTTVDSHGCVAQHLKLGNSSVSRVFPTSSSHGPALTYTWQIYMCCYRSSIASSPACKIARTRFPAGRWRCVSHLQSTRKLTLTLFGTPERNGFLSWTIVAPLVRKFQPYTFCHRRGSWSAFAVKIQFPNIGCW